MQQTAITSTILSLAALAASAPAPSSLESRQQCYPWFIAALPQDCSIYNPTAQLSSGPEVSPPPAAYCQPLSPGVSFPAASVNPNACADDTYTITLYTTADCSDPGTAFGVPQCLSAPPGTQFVSYSAVPNIPQ